MIANTSTPYCMHNNNMICIYHDILCILASRVVYFISAYGNTLLASMYYSAYNFY